MAGGFVVSGIAWTRIGHGIIGGSRALTAKQRREVGTTPNPLA